MAQARDRAIWKRIVAEVEAGMSHSAAARHEPVDRVYCLPESDGPRRAGHAAESPSISKRIRRNHGREQVPRCSSIVALRGSPFR